ncbi:MAG: L-fucose mutarotase [Opitutaceae bacterium]|nr:L-fucose mutarotase [Opitutaceae bacterium]
MLKTINSLLGPDILHFLASMGHGDELVIADANFPSASLGNRLVRLDGVGTPQALAAVLTLFPLDQYVDHPAAVMAVVDNAEALPDIYDDFTDAITVAEGQSADLDRVERFDFYERAGKAFGIIATGERRLYGNIIIRKGVVTSMETS